MMRSILAIGLAFGLSLGVAHSQEEQFLDLEGMSVIGNRELPKSLVIVPWKKAEPGNTAAPLNSLLDEVLEPVDRDVFRRQLNYYHTGRLRE